MKTRKRSRDAVPSQDGEFESWISDLTGGETTARRLRKRLEDQAGEHLDADCSVCERTSTGKIYFGLDGHLHDRGVPV